MDVFEELTQSLHGIAVTGELFGEVSQRVLLRLFLALQRAVGGSIFLGKLVDRGFNL